MLSHRAAIAAAILSAAPASGQTLTAETPTPVQQIAIYSYGFTPGAIHLAAGRPVTLVFANRSGNGHDFTARDFFARARIIAGTAPGGKVELAGGQSASVTLVPAPGRYPVTCSHFFHKQMGMRAQIVVD